MFGDCRVVVTFLEARRAGDAAAAGRRLGRPPGGGFAPPAAAGVRAPAAAAPSRPRPATRRRPPQAGYQQPEPAYQAPQQSYAPPLVRGRARRRRRGRGPRRLARDGGPDGLPRRRHRDAPPLQPRGEVDARPGDLDAVRRHRRRSSSRSRRSSRPPSTSAPRRSRYEAWQAAGKESKSFLWKDRSPVVRGRRVRRPRRRHRARRTWASSGAASRAANFVIGSDADVDAPVSADFVPSSSHPLVAATGADYVVNVTPRMGGEVYVDGQSYQLQQFIQQRGSSFSLPQGGSARLDCGETTFVVTATAAAAHARGSVPRPGSGASRSTRSAPPSRWRSSC